MNDLDTETSSAAGGQVESGNCGVPDNLNGNYIAHTLQTRVDTRRKESGLYRGRCANVCKGMDNRLCKMHIRGQFFPPPRCLCRVSAGFCLPEVHREENFSELCRPGSRSGVLETVIDMFLTIMKSKLHRVRVTQAELNYVGSITIDEDLMDAANLLEHEKVQVVNNNNGERFETYVIKGERGSGTICLNGAAARRAQVGDIVIIMAYALMTPEEAKVHKPTVVFPDHNNRLVL
jgi:aspartate 1-decarboxylase